MPVSREDVRNGFRFILGREPENHLTLLKYMLFPSVESFRSHLIGSDEFQGKLKWPVMVFQGQVQDANTHPFASVDRPATAFIHLQKVGGTTFRSLLAPNFEKNRVCQVLENKLHLLSLAELAWFDLFSGHFDYASTELIQRRRVRTLAFFREPRQRLVSFYRFIRSHPPVDEFANSRSVELANTLGAEEFFEHPEIRAAPEVFNHYLLAFGMSSYEIERAGPLDVKAVTPQVLDRAKQNVRGLTGIGLTERFDESVETLFEALGFRVPRRITPLHVTDRLGKTDARFSKVEPVAMTPRLDAALDDLVKFDEELYRVAVAEFERRRRPAAQTRVSAVVT